MLVQNHLRKSGGRVAVTSLVVVLVLALLIVGANFLRQILFLSDESMLSLLISALETVGLLVSLILALRQLSDSKEIARATFLVELNRAYVENPEYIRLYNVLQTCVDGNCEQQCGESDDCCLDFPKSLISNYLTFFETIYLLIDNAVISFEVVDDLFAYRFFLAVHSRLVQQIKLVAQPENFVNIYRLEAAWLAYRKKVGKATGSDTIYGTACLKDQLPADRYLHLIGRD